MVVLYIDWRENLEALVTAASLIWSYGVIVLAYIGFNPVDNQWLPTCIFRDEVIGLL